MKNIIITGAGPVGSLLAVYLAKRGYNIHILERRPDMRMTAIQAGRSINLALSHRGWRGLKGAGVQEAIEKISIPMRGRMVHDEAGNQNFMPYGKEGQAIYSVSRREINVELMNCAEAFENVRISFNERCVDVDLETATATTENVETGERSVFKADYIIGADGAYSAIREKMQKTDRFNFSQDYLEHGYKELTIPAGEGGEFLIEKNALHIWPRHQYMLIALPNIDGSFTCTLFFPFEGNPSFASLKTDEQIKEFLQREFADIIPLNPNILKEFRDNPTSSLVTTKCFPWSFKDKVCLIGDAAHAVVPFYGQGMNAGFEDCIIFDTMLEKHGDDWGALFKDFETERKPSADAIAELAKYNFIEMRDKVADKEFLLKRKIESRIYERYPAKFTPLYTMVTFSHMPYADALRISREQDRKIAQIMMMPNIDIAWNTDEIIPLIDRHFKNVPDRVVPS
ncbi:MAG TPA: NAD(P)/FAD-dependent oxidoreductase [Patescibacteria group bacterium]|nr:NAD(P)/FAD-dependent oxidoreductase [Patescibacteria group bacterium]